MIEGVPSPHKEEIVSISKIYTRPSDTRKLYEDCIASCNFVIILTNHKNDLAKTQVETPP